KASDLFTHRGLFTPLQGDRLNGLSQHLMKVRCGIEVATALLRQSRHRYSPAAIDLTDHVLDRHSDVVEEYLRKISRVVHLLDRPNIDSVVMAWNHQEGDALVFRSGGVCAYK